MEGDSILNNASSESGQSIRSTRRQESRKKLAIENQSKIDRESKTNAGNGHRPSVRIVVTKWFTTGLLGVLLITCTTTSKVSVLVLSDSMNKDDSIGQKDYGRMFVMLQILALVPNIVNFFRGVLAGAFRQDLPWPRKNALVMGFFISFIESLGLSLFIFNLPGLTEVHNVVLLMNCVFLVPLLSIIYNSFKSPVQNSWRVLFHIALAFELIGIGMTGYSMKDMKSEYIWMAPVGVILLSISWTPTVLNYLLITEDATHASDEDTDVDNDETDYMGTTSSTRGGSRSSGYQSIIEDDSLQTSVKMPRIPPPQEETRSIKTERSTWKLTIYMSFLKIIFTLGISMLIFNIKHLSANQRGRSMKDYAEGWRNCYESKEILYFASNIVTSVVGYSVGYMACTTCMQRWAFAVPLVLTTPLTLTLLSVDDSCEQIFLQHKGEVTQCTGDSTDRILVFGAAGCLVFAQAISTGWLIFRSQFLVMLKEDQLFWVPMYNSTLLEQWFMLVRRNEYSDVLHEDPVSKAKRSKVIICTTMYREAEYEMRQLLESIQGINLAQASGGRHFESHVFFDGAVKDKNPTEFLLQLVSLVESTLGVKAEHCSKTMTPYGLDLAWRLNAESGQTGMIFKIHLKDNFKVKNKKRWSQVMYMSYVLDFLMVQRDMDVATEEETYILTTDADVRFTPDSVEALLDLMTRDHSVGAVCARTHPLGSGPIVWYQIFEYAIGHWFQKAAEHVIGSVLCSPGCFSVYRCKAIKDILPQYASNVEHAIEFLTKDMGEDRWFCTLMVQSGWRIEYCATSENSTHCPEEFDEFFKQRRRWVASTIANLMLLLKEWHIIAKLNHRVPFVFLIYQAILLFATLIGPSSVILVLSGGLKYSWDWHPAPSLVIQIVICVGFALVCLFTSSDTQLSVAKFLTFVYAILMAAVVVGTAVQITTDFNGSADSFISDTIRVSTTTVYVGVMAGIFLLAGVFHLGEVVYLLHGVWYLLCLPAGYLILMIYSICNITDRSWGTREVKTHSVLSQTQNWQDTVIATFKSIFFCCFNKQPETKHISTQTDTMSLSRSSRTAPESEASETVPMEEASRTLSTEFRLHSFAEGGGQRSYKASVYAQDDVEDGNLDIEADTVVDVKDWLPHDMKQFDHFFIDNGFENTMLISGMTENELKDIGIKRKGMQKYLMEEIKKLPDYDIQAEVPENVEEWLKVIGLEQYRRNFTDEQIKTAKDMEILKSFGRTELERELKIKKSGHIKRLMYAIRKLRNPTKSELRMMEVKKALMVPMSHQLKSINIEEYEFWDTLRNLCLMPQSTAFGLEDDLRVKLGDLRNNWLLIFAVSNTLWLTLIYTLAEKGEILSVFGSNPIGLVVLVLFGFVLVIQFCAMIVHRVSTLTHFLGRAPYRFGGTYNKTWAFNDSDMRQYSEDMDAVRQRDYAVRKAYRRLAQRKVTLGEKHRGEHSFLLTDE